MNPAPSTQKPKTSIGRYQLVRHLASGGMADVLVARATGIEGFERHVVLKRIREQDARDAMFVKMFLDEARLAASLHHHNIVQVHDIGQDAGEYFFAMEYVHGEDLRKLLTELNERDQFVPIEHVVAIVQAAAEALHYAHEHRGLGIVHRDVSPANILVSYDGHVKVVDFGIAKATESTTETRSGVIKGKVAYMSPEQCVGEPVDRRGDIFCLGIVLYELVTVRRLFKGANDFLTMSSITHGAIPRPSEVRTDLSPELEAIIMKALAAKPEDRYQTAGEMRAALEQFAIHAQLRTSPAALADYMREVFGNRPLPWEVNDDDDDQEVSIDFDGSASGLVDAPEAALQNFSVPDAQPRSPIVRARSHAITNAPPFGATMQTSPEVPSALPAIVRPASRRWPWAVGAFAVVAVAVIALLAMPTKPRAAAAAARPTTHVAPPPVVPAAPVVTPPPPPPPTDPVIETIEPAATTPSEATTKRKKVKVPVKAPRGNWDPNSLFPEPSK